jgi:hypothetical protein
MDFLFKLGSFDENDKKKDDKKPENEKSHEENRFMSFTQKMLGWTGKDEIAEQGAESAADHKKLKTKDDGDASTNINLPVPRTASPVRVLPKVDLEMSISPGGGTRINADEQDDPFSFSRGEMQSELQQSDRAEPTSMLSKEETLDSEKNTDFVKNTDQGDDVSNADGYETSFEELPGSPGSSPGRRSMLPPQCSDIIETSYHSSIHNSPSHGEKNSQNAPFDDEDSIGAMYGLDSDDSDYSESILVHADSILHSSNERESFDIQAENELREDEEQDIPMNTNSTQEIIKADRQMGSKQNCGDDDTHDSALFFMDSMLDEGGKELKESILVHADSILDSSNERESFDIQAENGLREDEEQDIPINTNTTQEMKSDRQMGSKQNGGDDDTHDSAHLFMDWNGKESKIPLDQDRIAEDVAHKSMDCTNMDPNDIVIDDDQHESSADVRIVKDSNGKDNKTPKEVMEEDFIEVNTEDEQLISDPSPRNEIRVGSAQDTMSIAAEADETRIKQEEKELIEAETKEAARLEKEDAGRTTAEAETSRKKLEVEEFIVVEAEAVRVQKEEEDRIAAEAEAARLKQVEEDCIAAEAEAARLKQEEEERIVAETEAVRIKQEEKERIVAEAKAVRIKQEEGERIAAEAEEAARLKQEKEQRIIAEAEQRFAAEAEARRLKQVEEAEQRIAAEAEEASRLKEQEEQRVVAEDEAARLKQEEEEEQRVVAAEAEEAARIKEEQRVVVEAEDARLKQEEEKRIAAEAEEARRLKQEEEGRIAAEAAEKTARLKQEQEEDRIAVESEGARIKQKEEERIAVEAEARRLKQVEEEEQHIAAEAEEAARLKEEEEQRVFAEAEAARLKQEEEQRVVVAEAEEAARIKEEQRVVAAEAEEAARIKEEQRVVAEAEAARIKQEEEEEQRVVAAEAEEVARLKREEEEEERITAEAEEARRLKQVEEGRIAAEAAKKTSRLKEEKEDWIAEESEDARIKQKEEDRIAAEAEARRVKQVEEAEQRIVAEAKEAARLKEQEEQRAVAEAEAARLKQEEEQRVVAAEAEEAARIKEEQRIAAEAEEVARLKQEEEERIAAEGRIAVEVKAAKIKEEERIVSEAEKSARLKQEEEESLAVEAAEAESLNHEEEEHLAAEAEASRIKQNEGIDAEAQEADKLNKEKEDCIAAEVKAVRITREEEGRIVVDDETVRTKQTAEYLTTAEIEALTLKMEEKYILADADRIKKEKECHLSEIQDATIDHNGTKIQFVQNEDRPSNPFAGGGIAAAVAKAAMKRNQQMAEKQDTNDNINATTTSDAVQNEDRPSNPFAGGGIAAAVAKAAMKRNQQMAEKQDVHDDDVVTRAAHSDEMPSSGMFVEHGADFALRVSVASNLSFDSPNTNDQMVSDECNLDGDCSLDDKQAFSFDDTILSDLSEGFGLCDYSRIESVSSGFSEDSSERYDLSTDGMVTPVRNQQLDYDYDSPLIKKSLIPQPLDDKNSMSMLQMFSPSSKDLVNQVHLKAQAGVSPKRQKSMSVGMKGELNVFSPSLAECNVQGTRALSPFKDSVPNVKRSTDNSPWEQQGCDETSESIKFLAKIFWDRLVAQWKHNKMTRMLTARPPSHHFTKHQRHLSVANSGLQLDLSKCEDKEEFYRDAIDWEEGLSSASNNLNGFCPSKLLNDPKVPKISSYLMEVGPLPFYSPCIPDCVDSKATKKNLIWDGIGTQTLRHELRKVLAENKLDATIDLLRKTAKRNHGKFLQSVNDIVSFASKHLRAETTIPRPLIGVKKKEAIASKAQRKYGGDVLQVKDILRGQIVFPDEASLVCALVHLHKTSIAQGTEVSTYKLARIKNLFRRTSSSGTLVATDLPSGYRHVLVNLRLPNGFLAGMLKLILNIQLFVRGAHVFFPLLFSSEELQLNLKSVFDIQRHKGYKVHQEIIKLQKWEKEQNRNEEDKSLDLLEYALKNASMDISARPHDASLYLCIHDLYVERFLRTKSEADKKNAEKAILRSIEMIENANAIGMVGWVGYGKRHVLDRALERPFETQSNLASFYGLTNNWNASVSVLRSLILRCDQHLPLYHPITITTLVDLAAALLENGESDLAFKFCRRARDRLLMYLHEQDEACSRMQTMRKSSSTDHDRSQNEEYYKLVGLDHLDMLKVFAKNMNDLLSRKMMSVQRWCHPMRLLFFCFVGDSFSVLASNISRESDKLRDSQAQSEYCAESESTWTMAGKYYKQALRGWAKIKEPNHPDIMSTACSLARCLSELGRKREALRLLSSIVESAKRALDVEQTSSQEDGVTTCGISPAPSSDLEKKPNQRYTTNTVETLVVCVWSMAVYTMEDRPNEEGRVRAMGFLKSGIEILEKHGAKINKSERASQLLVLFKDEFNRMFEGKRIGDSSSSKHASTKHRTPLSFVTV